MGNYKKQESSKGRGVKIGVRGSDGKGRDHKNVFQKVSVIQEGGP